jgi:hypothetical protein
MRHEYNPYLEYVVTRPKMYGKKVSDGSLKDKFDAVTGEAVEVSRLYSTVKDSSTFIKIFTESLVLTFNLRSSGLKALHILLWEMQRSAKDKDTVYLNKYVLDDFLEDHKGLKYSSAEFYRGLANLVESDVICKTMRPAMYYINPCYCFNGQREKHEELMAALCDKRTNDIYERQGKSN